MAFFVDQDGIVYLPSMTPIGFFDVNGDVYDRNNIQSNGYPFGIPCGFVDIAGDVYNAATAHIGFVDVDGTIYDMGMLQAGAVLPNGEVRDLAGRLIATIHLSLHKSVHQKGWRQMPYRAAGAVKFLLTE